MSKREDIICDLISMEHGDCESSTCDIAHALHYACHLAAAKSLVSAGAASDELGKLMGELSRDELRELKKQEKLLASHAASSCPHCNAYTWDLDNQMDKHGNVYCSSCGRDYHIESAQNFKEGDLK